MPPHICKCHRSGIRKSVSSGLLQLRLLLSLGGPDLRLKLMLVAYRSSDALAVLLGTCCFRSRWTMNVEIQCANDLDSPSL